MSAPSPLRLHRALSRIWDTPPGLGRLKAVNHTVIGRRFIVAALFFFAVGGLLAMLIRVQLATSQTAFLGPEIYGQIFTMHGTVMMFLFAIPAFEGLAMYLLPKMLGARDMAFPRLSAYGFWCYVFGGGIIIFAMLAGVAPDAGWFMYTPLSSGTYSPGINADVWLIGITFVEISALAAAIEIIVTILRLRAPGMTLARMPILAWYLLVTAFMMLAAFPPLILGSILLEVERAFDWPFFDPTRGGDPLLWQHLFWLFGHPEVYIIFLPAAGMISTILPVLSRRALLGYAWIVVSIIALAFLSFGLWVHHMFTVGIPHIAQGFFSAASMLVAIPTAVQIFAWIGTLAAGRPTMKLPMLYLMGFFSIFVAGGLTGVMLAVVPFNWQAHDTHFVVAHLHYVLIGGFVFPMLAAAYYWLPHFTGRESPYGLGRIAFWLIFTGFHVTFLVMHFTGLLGMPRRVEAYEAGLGWDWPNLVSSLGSFVMTIGFAAFIADMVLQIRLGRRTRRNPWNAGTLEWATMRPAPSYAFASLPEIADRAPLHAEPDLPRRLAAGEGYLGFARNGWQETLGVGLSEARITQTIVLPRPSWLPLATALATGVFFVGLLLKAYIAALLGVALTIALFFLWTRTTGATRDSGPLPVGKGVEAPPHWESPEAPSRMAMTLILIANGVLLTSLVFALLFLWVVAPGWPPPGGIEQGWAAPLIAALGLAAAALGGRAAKGRLARGQPHRAQDALTLAAALLAVLALAAQIAWFVPSPREHAYGAVVSAMLVYVAIQAAISALLALYCLLRGRSGYVSAVRNLDHGLASAWHDYAAAAGIGVLALLALSAGAI